MAKYVDYKYTSWGRMYFSDDTNMLDVIKKLQEGYTPPELANLKDLKFEIFEHLDDTEEYITPEENNNQPTIEVYSPVSNTIEMLWDNTCEPFNKKDNDNK